MPTVICGDVLCRDGATERLLSDDDDDDAAANSFRRSELPEVDRLKRHRRSGIHNIWHRLDKEYLKPVFGGHSKSLPGMRLHGAKKKMAGISSESAQNVSSSRHRALSGAMQRTNTSGGSSPPHVSLADIARNHDASHDEFA